MPHRHKFLDPRERALFLLGKRKSALRQEEDRLLKQGKTLSKAQAQERTDVKQTIADIRAGRTPQVPKSRAKAASLPVEAIEPIVKCYMPPCKKMVDLREPRYVWVPKEVIEHDPNAPMDKRAICHYRPNIGDAAICVRCGKALLGRFDEQDVEEA